MSANQKAKTVGETVEVVTKTQETVTKAAKAGADAFAKAAKASTDSFAASYEQALAASKEQFEKFMPSAVKNLDEFAGLGKSNFDAFVRAGTIAAKGFEMLGQQVAAYNKGAVEANLAAAQAIFGAKNVQEFVELQTGFAREAFDRMVAETTKLSELSIQIANETAEPLNARFNETLKKMAKPLAA